MTRLERKVTARIAVRYLFPVHWRDHDIVYVVMIRRAERTPLNEPEYLALWQAELAALTQS